MWLCVHVSRGCNSGLVVQWYIRTGESDCNSSGLRCGSVVIGESVAQSASMWLVVNAYCVVRMQPKHV